MAGVDGTGHGGRGGEAVRDGLPVCARQPGGRRPHWPRMERSQGGAAVRPGGGSVSACSLGSCDRVIGMSVGVWRCGSVISERIGPEKVVRGLPAG